jgi:hypothetical protein
MRARRALGWLIDTAPLWVAASPALVLASAETLMVLRSTSARTLGDLVAGTRVEPAAPVPK